MAKIYDLRALVREVEDAASNLDLETSTGFLKVFIS